MLNAIMLRDVMLNVIMLCVVTLNTVVEHSNCNEKVLNLCKLHPYIQTFD
jgi:hypothetical protein